MSSKVACKSQVQVVWRGAFQEELSNELQKKMSEAAIGAVRQFWKWLRSKKLKSILACLGTSETSRDQNRRKRLAEAAFGVSSARNLGSYRTFVCPNFAAGTKAAHGRFSRVIDAARNDCWTSLFTFMSWGSRSVTCERPSSS